MGTAEVASHGCHFGTAQLQHSNMLRAYAFSEATMRMPEQLRHLIQSRQGVSVSNQEHDCRPTFAYDHQYVGSKTSERCPTARPTRHLA